MKPIHTRAKRTAALGEAAVPSLAKRMAALLSALVCSLAMVTSMAVPAAADAGDPYPCGSFAGANNDASAIGWLGNGHGATVCLGGSFYVPNGIDTTYGFGIYNNAPTTWENAEGYLPALVTGFEADGAQVSITNFGDKVTMGGNDYVLIFSRVSITNPTDAEIALDPQPAAGMVELSSAGNEVAPSETVSHDYVVAADRFANGYAWPDAGQLAEVGGYDDHYANMRDFWDSQISELAMPNLPDERLVEAYLSGFIYTQISRSGYALNTGTNGYHQEFNHDVTGILAGLFNHGYFKDAHALLDQASASLSTPAQYSDGYWTYPWLWSVYYRKTGDLDFLKARFATPGPQGEDVNPSIKSTAHRIADDRTGPNGIMGASGNADALGYFTTDNYVALLGLASYRYLAEAVGDSAEAEWADAEFNELLEAVDATLAETIETYDLDYIPCSILQPNTTNSCADPAMAGWAGPGVYYNYAWNGYLLGADLGAPDGIAAGDWADKTFDWGFALTRNVLPQDTFGGYGGQGFYSTAYNAAYGSWGLAGTKYRDQAIQSYLFMIENSQAGPYSWWEGADWPSQSTPWIGNHPKSGGGSSPHSWGIELGNQALIDSVVTQRVDGTIIVGRGVPNAWVVGDEAFGVTNYPISYGNRMNVDIVPAGTSVTVNVSGAVNAPIQVHLPAAIGNIASTSAGSFDSEAGTVTLPSGTSSVVITFQNTPSTERPRPDAIEAPPAEPSTLAPILETVSPEAAAAGDEVTLTGANFGETQDASHVRFTNNGINWGDPGDEADFEVVSWSDTKIVYKVPEPSKGYEVTPGTPATMKVVTPFGVSSSLEIDIVAETPTPTDPATDPTDPTAEPTDPTTDPTGNPSDPTDSSSDPTAGTTDPATAGPGEPTVGAAAPSPDRMPNTGANALPLILGAALLLGLGVAIVLRSRRR